MSKAKKLNELTILEALEGLKAEEFTSLELTEACLAQIKSFDKKINAFVTVTEELAIEQAKQADKRIKSEGKTVFDDMPLLGIPYACKDNFSTKDIETTASSNILKGYIPPFESTVTKKLANAGAVLLGKTNMDAFAHGSSTETSDFGPTKNPWNTNKIPGGSSGGSAAAVAANMCIFSIGSETAGSIRGPASWCGVTGLKPTYGRVSRYGAIAMASSTDSPGPITKSVADAAIVLRIIAGKDPFDATSSHLQVENYLENLNSVDLSGLKIGRPKQYFDERIDLSVLNMIDDVCAFFKEKGAQIIDLDMLDTKYSIAVYTILQRAEVSSNLARFDGIRFGHDRESFGFEAKKRMMLGAYALSAGYYDAFYSKAQKVRTLLVEDFNTAFEKVDVLISPTLPTVAMDLGAADTSPFFGELIDALQEPSAIAGLAAITVPCGFDNDLPVGVQFIGPQFSESKILSISDQYQKETGFHMQFPDLTSMKGEN